MSLTETQSDGRDLFILRKGNYTIEQLADDFRYWASKHLDMKFGSFITDIDLGYEIFLGDGFKDYDSIGKIEIEANDVVRISANSEGRYSKSLKLKEYKPFLN